MSTAFNDKLAQFRIGEYAKKPLLQFGLEDARFGFSFGPAKAKLLAEAMVETPGSMGVILLMLFQVGGVELKLHVLQRERDGALFGPFPSQAAADIRSGEWEAAQPGEKYVVTPLR